MLAKTDEMQLPMPPKNENVSAAGPTVAGTGSNNSARASNPMISRIESLSMYPAPTRAGILANPVIRAVLASSTPPAAAEIASAPGVHAQFLHDTLSALRRAGFIDATSTRRGVVYFATQRVFGIMAATTKRNGGENE